MGPRRHRHRRYSAEITRCFAQDSIVCAKMVTRGRIEPFCLGKMLANRNRPLALPLRGQTAKDAEEFDSPARSYENSGDPWENRTPVYGVRGRRLDRLTNGPRLLLYNYKRRRSILSTLFRRFLQKNCRPVFRSAKEKCRHLPIFPGRLQPSIFGTTELNCCVRNGNRWNLGVIGTGYLLEGLHPQN